MKKFAKAGNIVLVVCNPSQFPFKKARIVSGEVYLPYAETTS
jgi:hypothetical protein